MGENIKSYYSVFSITYSAELQRKFCEFLNQGQLEEAEEQLYLLPYPGERFSATERLLILNEGRKALIGAYQKEKEELEVEQQKRIDELETRIKTLEEPLYHINRAN